MLRDRAAQKLDRNYQGPFTTVRANTSNSYILKDSLGNLLLKPVPLNQIKVIMAENWNEDSSHGEINGIINHRGNGQNLEYLVAWKEGGADWIPAENILTKRTVNKYWKRRNTASCEGDLSVH